MGLEAPRLEAAWQRLIERHDMLLPSFSRTDGSKS